MLNRSHDMPFGASLLGDGSARFRLWAPNAGSVELCLAGGPSAAGETGLELPMTRQADGWFELITPAAAGSRYRYRIDGGMQVPDPASRGQPEDVHGPSELVDPAGWDWRDGGWNGRPWEEAVFYELHVGSFSPEGSFDGVRRGYDGVYPFAPDRRYGSPEDLKALVQAAHERGLMIFLDVVYNHFGPEGNYLHLYAPQFFTDRHQTPWGAAINFDDRDCGWVRQFFIHNALYWLEEYHFDGLRLDAVHAIADDSRPDILTELAERVRDQFGDRRHIHLVLENDENAARYLERDSARLPRWYAAQWNDDLHHAVHVLVTGEAEGYYRDYADDPVGHLGRCLTEGFAYQSERSPYRDGQPRGEPSGHLPPTAFVGFVQNHDQVGNRAFGERLGALAGEDRLRAALALLLLAPAPPLLFMGQEWNSGQPFPFFCDFGADLADKVVAGRRREFAHFPEFSDPQALEQIPDPMDPATFDSAVLDWAAPERPEHRPWLELHRRLLALRRQLTPRLRSTDGNAARLARIGARALSAHWGLGRTAELALFANLGEEAVDGVDLPAAAPLYSTHAEELGETAGRLPAWSVTWYLQERHAGR